MTDPSAVAGCGVLVAGASRGIGLAIADASWQAGFDIDLMAAVRCNRAALPLLRASHHACILNISSINALRPTPRVPAYSAAKAALNYYTTTLAAELARERIRVNAIAPGSIEFPGGLWDQRRAQQPELYRRIRAAIPFGDFGALEDVSNAALFLASPQARWITGQVLALDGGQSLGARGPGAVAGLQRFAAIRLRISDRGNCRRDFSPDRGAAGGHSANCAASTTCPPARGCRACSTSAAELIR